MAFKNDERNKKDWINNENKMRRILVGLIISVIVLIILIAFFPSVVWAIVLNILTTTGLVVSLIVNLNTLSNIRKGK